ncbi:hypothetical protein G9C98_000467 [Cotesia typhae]|uniref:Uncharacterized protein n=1 Tax=Cotesia typhae TaxID=2053667 RepID=A0A8J5VAZ7_9HYME|nr:hypothetical protein G9C98_000467 [Cotesia typhae]
MSDFSDINNNTEEFCRLQYNNFSTPDGEIWCNWVWDSILCWPPIKASSTVTQRCPLANGIDTTKFAERRCSDDGRWLGRNGERSSNGWTNYTPCFTPEMLLLIRKLYTGDEHAAKIKLDIAEKTRTLEFVGLTTSLAALLLSLAIFWRFRQFYAKRVMFSSNTQEQLCSCGCSSKVFSFIIWLQLNFLFLMNIVRVLVVKLRQSRTSETQQARKAVRAAAVLLPLLGITNLISMAAAPLETTIWFAIWSYTTHFLTSFQGLFIATLYCFLNGEVKLLIRHVRIALKKTMSVYMSLRGSNRSNRRLSTFSGCHSQRIAADVDEGELRSRGWIRLCCRDGDTPPSDRRVE